MEKRSDYYEVKATYECLRDSPPRGRFVTFITYPDFEKDDYQIVKELNTEGKATVEFYPTVPDFTFAAIGDGGDTRLTLNLETLSNVAPQERAPRRQRPKDQKPEVPGESNAPNLPLETAGTAPSVAASKSAEPASKAAGESSADPESSGQAAVPSGYTFGPVGFNSEFCGIGGNQAIDDRLRVKEFAERLAELIALRETRLPLAVGLFGNWGSGKSYFMNLMDRHLKSLAKEEKAEWDKRATAPGAPLRPDPNNQGPWCREIVPVYFNAWHYVDTNLWASLVTEIFDGLNTHLKPKQDELALMHSKLRDAGGATARAEEEVLHAHEAVRQASASLQEARVHSESARQVVQGLLDNLRTLVPQVNTPENRRRIIEWLGVSAETATLSQLVAKQRELESWPSRLRELWRRVTAKEGRWWRVGWLLGLLIIGPWTVQFAAKYLPFLKDFLGHIGPVVERILVSAIGFIAWITPAAVKIKQRLVQMESWQKQAEEAQAARPKDQKVIAANEKVVQAEAAAAAAEAGLAVAKALEQQLTLAVDELRPERRLSRFIEVRARSADYRGQLGLVSLARRDFQELSDIFADAEALQKKMDELPEEEAERLRKLGASIDRIVLFVDDLDRCQPEKIVDVLQAVHLLLAFPLFSVVVGVDQRCLRQSLREQFKGLLTPDQQNGVNGSHTILEGNGERPATPLDYLEKIFHVPFHLPPMEKTGFEDLVEKLTEPPQYFPTSSKKTQSDASSKRTKEVEKENDPLLTLRKVGVAPEEVRTTTATFEPEFVLPVEKPSEEKSTMAPQVTSDEKPPQVSPKATEAIGSVPLLRWERDALKDYHDLIRTPRGTTRLLNTYRLVRAGVPEADWGVFCGDKKNSGEFRIAMLFLAVSAGCPAVARQWFAALRSASENKSLESRDPTGISSAEWIAFEKLYDTTKAGLNPKLSDERLKTWLKRVERFTF